MAGKHNPIQNMNGMEKRKSKQKKSMAVYTVCIDIFVARRYNCVEDMFFISFSLFLNGVENIRSFDLFNYSHEIIKRKKNILRSIKLIFLFPLVSTR